MQIPLTALVGWARGDMPASSRRDEVVVASGQVSGQVQGIDDGKLLIQSDLDQDPIGLPVKDVLALRLAVPAHQDQGIFLSVEMDPDRPPLRLVPGPVLTLAADPAVAIALPVGGLTVRVEGGRRCYLSSLTPDLVKEEGAFGVVWHYALDRNIDGSPLRLGGIRYAHGLVVHSQATLGWHLNQAYGRLRALAGISDVVQGQGDCAVTILGDGRVLWHRDSVKGTDRPIPLDLDVGGVRDLRLQVDYGARYDIGDHFVLADATLVRIH